MKLIRQRPAQARDCRCDGAGKRKGTVGEGAPGTEQRQDSDPVDVPQAGYSPPASVTITANRYV